MTAAISPFRASLFLFWLPPPCVLSLPFLPTAGPAGLILQHSTCTAALWGAAGTAPATGTPVGRPVCSAASQGSPEGPKHTAGR